MNRELNSNDTKKLWQDQPLEGMTMSLKEVHERIEKLGRTVRRRNVIGGFACITVLLGFSYFCAAAHNSMERVGAALTAFGAAYIMYQLVLRKMKVGLRPLQAQAESVAFYRSELQRQRNFHRGIWFWSRLIVFAPGPFIFCFGLAEAVPSQTKYIWIEAAVCAVLLVVSIPLNLRLAGYYQRELDMLDSIGN
jgi:hypothetical protein